MPETTALPEMSVFTPRLYPKVVFPDDPLHASPRLWTKPELVEWTQASSEFISGEIRAGRLKAEFLSSGRLRFHWSDIVAWMQSRTQTISLMRRVNE